jgi:chitodextrinase
MGFKDKTVITEYNRASNTNASEKFSSIIGDWVVTEGTKSINFNTEYDEFSLTQVSRGLYRKHYQDYITSIFDKGTRVFDLEMKADLAFLLKYNINDTLTIKGEEFIINNIRTNLTTGLTKLELVLKFFTELVDDSVGALLSEPTGLGLVFRNRNSIVFNWNSNPSDQLVKGYKIYVDGSLVDTILLQTAYTLTGLDASTTYSIQVSAYNSQGLESSLSTPALSVTTLATDTQPPTAPTNLRLVSMSEVDVTIDWSASTDNVGVAGYEVYVDGVLNKTVTDTTAEIYGLSSATRYEVYVRAKDAVPNYSEISNTIVFKTL